MINRIEPLSASRTLVIILLLMSFMIACIGLGITFGSGNVTLWHLLPGSNATEIEHAIIFEIRLPRVLIAGLLGGALAVAGVVFQALLRNPLADPYVLGVSGGASIGGVLAILTGLVVTGTWFGSMVVPVCAFAGALGALFLIETIATIDGRLTVYTVLLTGVIFNAFAAAVIFFIESIASLEQLHEIVFYLMGRVPSPGHKELVILGIAIIFVTMVLVSMCRDYNALSLGDESAMHLGVDVDRVKRRTFILGSLLTAITVSVAGLIGFVGLVVPHMLRLVFGPDHRLLLPAAFFGGGGFLILADMFARLIISPNELPVGVVTALIGGPCFLYLLHTRSKSYDH